MNEFTKPVSINSLKYLYNVHTVLNNYSDANILKFHYMQKCKKIEIRHTINLPEKVGRITVKCPKCRVIRSSNFTKFKIDPVRKGRFTKKLLKKVEKGRKVSNYQQNFLKKMEADNSKLVILCNICNTEVKENLGRHTKVKPTKAVTNKEEKNVKNDVKNQNKTTKKIQLNQHTAKKSKMKASMKLNDLLNPKHKRKSTSLKDFLKTIP